MFLLNIPPVSYADPWLFPLAERIKRTRQKQHRVAYLYEQPDNSTFRYRVYNMIQALDLTPDVSATYFSKKELGALDQALDCLDTLVVVRYRYDHELNYIVSRARHRGVRVLFDIDDMVFDVDYAHLILMTLDQDANLPRPDGPWDNWFAYCGRQGASLKLCDGAITTNEYLAEQLHRFSGKPVSLIPNLMNREQLEISRRIYEQKQARGFARTPWLHVGYFSGTPTHNRDLDIAAGALARLLDARSDVVLRVVGFMDIKGQLADYRRRIEICPFQDFVNLQRFIGDVEVNLMPLQDNTFTNSKSELKYFEAGIVGTVSIASPVFTYAKAITDGDNGYLANNQDWDQKLAQAVALVEDPASYRAMAERAFDHSEQNYAWYRYTDRIAETLLSRQPLAVPAPSQVRSVERSAHAEAAAIPTGTRG